MVTIPKDGSIEAEYADGYVLSETLHDDVSPYTGTDNILNDILEKRAEAEHGKLVRFSCFYKDNRYDVDFSDLPDNARPVRYKRMEADTQGNSVTAVRMTELGFGYQYNDENGANIQHITELHDV